MSSGFPEIRKRQSGTLQLTRSMDLVYFDSRISFLYLIQLKSRIIH